AYENLNDVRKSLDNVRQFMTYPTGETILALLKPRVEQATKDLESMLTIDANNDGTLQLKSEELKRVLSLLNEASSVLKEASSVPSYLMRPSDGYRDRYLEYYPSYLRMRGR